MPALPFAAQPLRANKEKRRAVNILESVEGTSNCRPWQKRTHLFADLERGTTKRPTRNLEEARKVGGIRLARYTLRNHLPSFLFEIWSFSFEARYTVTRITLFQFADTTSMPVPQFKDFSGARESASSPAFNKDQRSDSFRPKNTQIISHPTAPRQSPRPIQSTRAVS